MESNQVVNLRHGAILDALTAPTEVRELVRVCGDEVVTDSLIIGNEFGRRHGNVLASLESLIEDGTISQLEFKSAEYHDAQGKPRKIIELTEAGALIAMPFIGGRKSRDGQKTLVRAFFAMRERLRALQAEKVATPGPVASPNKLTGELAVAECMARLTNVSESGKLAMIHAICAKNAVDTHFLPTQAVDGPPGAVSSFEAECATELLKRRGKGASTQSFNKRAKLAGYLRETSRPTTDLMHHSDGRKRYLIITPKGEAFGKNMVDFQSPRQTQPRWYTERFDAFCKLLWAETKDLTD
jgi:Rha family phage regulatory protein